MGSPKQNEEHLRAGIGSLWRAEPPYSHRVRLRRRAPSRLKVQRARHLRGDATLAEKQAWDILRGRRLFGLKFRRQHPIGGFIVDFYCAELGLVLELDGSGHACDSQVEYDAARSRRLESRGLRILRIGNESVREEALRRLLHDVINRPPSPQRGEGVRG